MRHKVQCTEQIAELFYLKNLLNRAFTSWKYKYKFDRYLKFVFYNDDLKSNLCL